MNSLITVALLSACATLATAQVTAGTRSADDHAREDAAADRINAAESALEKGDYRAAETTLKALAKELPNDAHILYDLGFAEEHNGEDDDAAQAYTSAVAADATLAEPLAALGFLDARKGRSEAAHRELTTVAAMTTAAPELRGRAYRALAALDEKSDPAQASAEELEAIKLTGETPQDTLMAADAALRTGDFADAEPELQKVLAADPNNLEARVDLGVALRQEGKLADAESVLEQGVKAHPDDVPLVSTLADTYMRDGKQTQAIPLIEGLRTRNAAVKSDPAVTELLARMDAMSDRNTDAETLYRELLTTNPNDPEALDALGSVLVKEMKYDEAESVLAKAVTLRTAFHDDQAWGEAASHLAFAASRNKHPQVVLDALASRATVLPDSPSSLFLAATAYDALHQRTQAEQRYKAFLAAAAGKFPDEEFEARHRLIALEHEK